MTCLVHKMTLKSLIFCALLQSGIVLGDRYNAFRDDYDYSDEINMHIKLHSYPRNWLNARIRCRQEGAQLFTPADFREAEFVKSLFEILPQSFKGIYLGLNAYWSEGDFASVEEKSITELYNMWNEDEPNNLNDNENCAVMTRTGKYSDVACEQVFPFLCVRSDAGLSWNSACNTYDMEYETAPGLTSCYKIHRDPKNWTDAYPVCKAEGGYLAMIKTDPQKNFLVKLAAKYPAGSLRGNFWKDVVLIGFHDSFVDREYEYIDGTRVSLSRFNGGEPNDYSTGQRCGAMYRNGNLDDRWCDYPQIFACERPITAAASGIGRGSRLSRVPFPRSANGG